MFGTETTTCYNDELEKTNSLINKSNENVQRSRFSKEEDEILKRLVNSQSHPKWSEIARCLNNRTARQCRERYNNYLRPDLINGPWSAEEEKLLIELYERHGPKWSLISQSFNSRSSVNVKNHYSSLVSSKSTKSPKSPKYQEIDNTKNKQYDSPKENNNSFIIEIIPRPIFETNKIIEEKKENEDINLNISSSSEDDYSIGNEMEFMMEVDNMSNILSNLEIGDDMWTFPLSTFPDEEQFIF